MIYLIGIIMFLIISVVGYFQYITTKQEHEQEAKKSTPLFTKR